MIIGIVGFMSSGKGTVGSILSEIYKFKTESFAKPVKDATAAIFMWPRNLLEGDNHISREFREQVDVRWSKALGIPNFTPRMALQMLGTEAGRNVFGENLWTHSCIMRCSDLSDKTENFVITDCRFKNEIKAIKDANGIVVRVKRGPEPDWYNQAINCIDHNAMISFMKDYNSNVAPGIHQSEWDWVGSKFDYVIENDGTVADLEKKVHDMLVDLKVVHKPFRQSKIHYEEQ